MSTAYVTIGGKEIYAMSGSAPRGQERAPKPAPPKTPAAHWPNACALSQTGDATRVLGCVLAFGLLIVLVIWLSRRRQQR